MKPVLVLQPFLSEFWRFDRRATAQTLGLNLAGALLEGLGLMLLLPLLHLAGVFAASDTTSLSRYIPAFAAAWLDGMAQDSRLLLMLGIFVSLIALQSAVALVWIACLCYCGCTLWTTFAAAVWRVGGCALGVFVAAPQQ